MTDCMLTYLIETTLPPPPKNIVSVKPRCPLSRAVYSGGMACRSLIGTLLILVACVALPSTAIASDNETDHERARSAMMAGKIAPLTHVLAKTKALFMGSILQVELESQEEENWVGSGGEETNFREGAGYGKPPGGAAFIYVISLLSPQGNVLKLRFDAKSIELLTVKGRDIKSARKP